MEDERKRRIKYSTYSFEFKKKIVNDVDQEYLKNESSFMNVVKRKAKMVGVNAKNIQRWYKRIKYDNLKLGRKAAFPEME